MTTRRKFFNLFFATGLLTLLPKGMKAATTRATSSKNTAMIHEVFFYLKNPEKDTAAFLQGCKELSKIKSIEKAYVGQPADTEQRDVVDHDFDVSLSFHFATLEEQDSYQKDPDHLAFIEKYQAMWENVKVYDCKIV